MELEKSFSIFPMPENFSRYENIFQLRIVVIVQTVFLWFIKTCASGTKHRKSTSDEREKWTKEIKVFSTFRILCLSTFSLFFLNSQQFSFIQYSSWGAHFISNPSNFAISQCDTSEKFNKVSPTKKKTEQKEEKNFFFCLLVMYIREWELNVDIFP